MTRIEARVFYICITAAVLCGSAALCRATPAPATPVIVTLNGVLNENSDDTPEFTPDGNTVFFDRSIGVNKFIMIAYRVKGRWMRAHIAPDRKSTRLNSSH